MEKCPHCGNGITFKNENRTIGGMGYPVKVISCFNCNAILGITLSDEMQGMIEFIYNKIRKLN